MATLICANCGASFDAKEPACPYCGHISYPGAEEKFMRDLNQVRDDLADVSKIPKKNYKKAMSKQSKIVLITVLIVLCIGGILAGVYFSLEKLLDTYTAYDTKAEMLWERENYPKVDEMYAAGDYDGILEFEDSLYEEDIDNHHSLYNWEHYTFIGIYGKYVNCKAIMELLDAGEELTKYEYEDIVYYAMWFRYKQYMMTNPEFTEEEQALVDTYQSEVEQIFYERLKFTDEEAEELYQKCMKKGYFETKPCYKYAKKIKDRFE